MKIWKQLLYWVTTFDATLRVLLFLGTMCGALLGFLEMAEEVEEGETKAIDEKIFFLLREEDDLSNPIGPLWFEEAARDITALGSYTIVSLTTLFTLGLLLLLKKKIEAMFCFLSVVSGTGLIHFLKIGFDRPRPDAVSHLVNVSTASFPSGHSTMAFVIFLSLTFLATRSLPSKATKIYVVLTSVFIASMIGFSRVYLGVHWPSDVLAGMCLGFFWALLWLGMEIIVFKKYLSRS
ncbi:MAG: hypothetical protein CME64_03080 [Halobacteriovoraceae bacterium]|nr:hypothetical protein [Halobacteriovoraceae bacterium]|tara:strand:- start:32332 stop:33039 length:708 start_codon:yes stop_codon:yes gene_type:complete